LHQLKAALKSLRIQKEIDVLSLTI